MFALEPVRECIRQETRVKIGGPSGMRSAHSPVILGQFPRSEEASTYQPLSNVVENGISGAHQRHSAKCHDEPLDVDQ
jgi:hypothetical protein